MVRNTAVESKKNIRTIKSSVQPASGSRHPRKLMGMLGGRPSTKMDGLGSSFQYEESISMVEESMEEFALASEEAGD